MKRLIATLVAAMVATLGLAQVAHAGTVGSSSGLPWQSGAYLDNHTAYEAPFASGRGRALDVTESFVTQDNAAEVSTDDWWAPVADRQTFLLTVPLWAANQTVNTNTTSMFTALGKTLVKDKLATKTIIRLGWEMNLNDWYWKLTPSNKTAWESRFKAAVVALRAAAPGIRIAFNPNEGNGSSIGNSALVTVATDLLGSYDYVGPDFYDQGSAKTSAGFTEAGGLNQWANFAVAKGKGYTVPEWGLCSALTPASETGSTYVAKMVAHFRGVAGRTKVPLVEALFNDPESGASFYKLGSSVPANWPNAGSAYRSALS